MRIYIDEHDGHEDLASAIIMKAAADYRQAWRKYRKGNEAAIHRIVEIEQFFNSEWAELLTMGLAKEILRRLSKEQREKPKKPKRTVKITKREIDK